MKTFIAALCAFALLLGGVTYNYVYVNQTTQAITKALEAVEATPSDPQALARLEALWENNRFFLGISISFDELQEMDRCIAQMRCALQLQDQTEFLLALSQASEAVKHLGRLERWSWECIF